MKHRIFSNYSKGESSEAMSNQIGAAVELPQEEVLGLLIVTSIVNLGLRQGENPIYEAMALSVV
ncbi:MAG: hypothetical protein NTY75_00390 [Candidatus Shapirobacteria bacterium]|nr:hypothetical protein [Candidatus Shapirobacteria bacterium]